MESGTTLTVKFRQDGNWVDKTISINSATGMTIDNIKKQLEVSLRDTNILYQNEDDGLWEVVENDKDLDAIKNGTKLKAHPKILSPTDRKISRNNRKETERKMETIEKRASDRSLRQKSLEIQYKEKYKGGTISYDDENWIYDSEGILTNQDELIDGVALSYKWDGELLLPLNKSYGGAQWDGTTLQWFLRDYEALKISGKRHVFVSFTIDDKKKIFSLVPNSSSPSIPDTFEFTSSYLFGTGSTQRWRITGEVPIPTVMCLVIIRYLRKGSQQFVRSDSISDTDTNSTNSENVMITMSTSTPNLNVALSYESNCMLKLANSKGWKKRWCVLKPNDNTLYCWKSQEDQKAGAEPREISLLSSVLVISMRKDKFRVVIKRERKGTVKIYQLLIDSRAQCDVWASLLIAHGSTKSGTRKEGYLRCNGRFWFVLQKRSISYYESLEDALRELPPKGVIDLVGCTISETNVVGGTLSRKRVGFVIQSNKTTSTLFADSLEEMNEWVVAILEVLEELRRRKENRGEVMTVTPIITRKLEKKPSNYLFDEEDSPANIVFVDPKDPEADFGRSPDDPPQVHGGTLVKLVERLTYDEYSDTHYLNDFLLTFRSFATPKEVLHLLIKRFKIPEIPDDSIHEKKRQIVHIRVYNVIKLWVEKFKDFEEDAELMKEMKDFISSAMMSVVSEHMVRNLLNRLSEGTKDVVGNKVPKNFPEPIMPSSKVSSSDAYELLDFDPEELARQITLIDFSLYVAIRPWEFFNKGWTKDSIAPNLFALINRFNTLTKWVASEIVLEENVKRRAKVVGKWIEIADKCNQMHNYNAVMAVVAALQSAGIFRLTQTWALVTHAQRELLETVRKVTSREGNFRNFRKLYRTCTPPIIPYFGVYLTDLTFIEDGNPNVLASGLINFTKRRRVASVLRDIMQHQQTQYQFQEVPFIQEFITSGISLDEDEVYNLSIQLEPKVVSPLNSVSKMEHIVNPKTLIETVRRERQNSRFEARARTRSGSSTLSPPPDMNSSRREQKARELQMRFFTAVQNGDIEKVKSLLDQGVMLKGFVEGHLQTPLHFAAYEGKVEMIHFLLSLQNDEIGKPDINAKDNSGWTALHCASSPGHLEACEILLKFGADSAIANNESNTSLHYIVRRAHEVFNKKTKKSGLPEESLYAKVIRLMLENGADINHVNLKGETPLHVAAAAGNEEAVKILLKNRANIFAISLYGNTPKRSAENQGHDSIAQLLCDAEEKAQLLKKEKETLFMEKTIVHIDDMFGIIKLMKDTQYGIRLKDRRWLLLLQRSAFTGEECVDWMIKTMGVQSRVLACAIGQKLLDAHFIRMLSRPRSTFKDGKYLYQFSTLDDYESLKAKIASARDNPIQPDDFAYLKVLGAGDHSKVLLSRKHDTQKLYAIKIINKLAFSNEEYELLLQEKTILQNDSPFLVHLHYTFQTDKYLFFVMDFVGGGDLGFHIKRRERMSEIQAMFITAELVLAIDYLHSRGVVYRDLKPENILIDRHGHALLTDFGAGKILSGNDDIMQTSVGCPTYTAPEVLEGMVYTKSIDWWSLGVVLYQMLLGFTPFEEDDDVSKLIKNVLTSRVLYPEDLVSHNAKSLLEAFLQKNPRKRLEDVDEIKHHPFFDINWDDLALKKIPSPIKIEMKNEMDVSHFEWKYTSQIVTDEFLTDPESSISQFELPPEFLRSVRNM